MTAMFDPGTTRAPVPEMLPGSRPWHATALLYLFVGVPFLALLAAVPVAWTYGWISPTDIALAVVFYCVTTAGIGVGFHRCFTHGAFTPNRPLKIALAIAGSLAIEGNVIGWVADHTRHHKYSDKDGDPHSPWRFGDTPFALLKGLWFAHIGWMFSAERAGEGSNPKKFAPKLLLDGDIVRVSRAFSAIVLFSLLAPPVIDGLVTWSLHGVITGFFWGTLVRMALMHHVTWSTNSIAHRFGEQPFDSRDHSTNVWWLAIFSFGESWHNLHHAYPSSARHGVGPHEIDINARTIRFFELLGWATNVKWPMTAFVDSKRRAQS